MSDELYPYFRTTYPRSSVTFETRTSTRSSKDFLSGQSGDVVRSSVVSDPHFCPKKLGKGKVEVFGTCCRTGGVSCLVASLHALRNQDVVTECHVALIYNLSVVDPRRLRSCMLNSS